MRVCVIGGGPCGLAVLHYFNKESQVQVVCYEQAAEMGGLWNYSWRTGTDQHGLPVHGSMYRGLWSNGPKECLELPDYTFRDHFGRNIPSFPPREVLRDYILGRARKENLQRFIRTNTHVQNVKYDEATRKFTVTVRDLLSKDARDEEFDYVIVSTGHFSRPHIPELPGMDRYTGQLLHSHDFRDARSYIGKRLLIVGGSYSAEDIALQTAKYGARSVIISHRGEPMGFKWPKMIVERELFERVDGNLVYFKDGSTAEVDTIILCTGYLHTYPFLPDNLQLRGPNVVYPDCLFKGVVWHTNPKLMYVGMQDQWYTFTMFEIQAFLAYQVITGKVKLPSAGELQKDVAKWVGIAKNATTAYQLIDFQTAYLDDAAKFSGFPYPIDCAKLFYEWKSHKKENICTYRDKSFKSIYTGDVSPLPRVPWWNEMDDTLQTFTTSKL